MDRTYCRQPNRGAHEYAGHVFLTWTRVPGRARTACNINVTDPVLADRLPSDWHLCGNCARLTFARTDVEMVRGLQEDADRDREIVAAWDRTLPPIDEEDPTMGVLL